MDNKKIVELEDRDVVIDVVFDAYTSGVGIGALNDRYFKIRYSSGTKYHAFQVKVNAPNRFNRPVRLTYYCEVCEYVSIVEIADMVIGMITAFHD